MDSSLTNQQVLIIGGSSGMGLGTAQLLDQLGATVLIAGNNPEKLDKARRQLGPSALSMVVDVLQPASVQALFAQIESIDHLFITAGPGSRSRFREDPPDDARRYMEGKFWSAYQLTRMAVPKLRPNGSVTYLSGGLSIRPESGSAMVTVAQRAVEGLAAALAVELAPLRFNVIRPGTIDTDLWDFMAEADRDRFMQEMAQKAPVGRVGTPADVAQAVAHFMTNSYLTGAILDVDGGLFLR